MPKACLVVGWLVGWLGEQRPTLPLGPPEKKIAQGWPQKRRQPLVLHGLDSQTCIDRRLKSDGLDVYVGWLLIPTRRGVGGFQKISLSRNLLGVNRFMEFEYDTQNIDL